MALAYATSDRGACHRRALPIEREAFDSDWDPERAAAAVIREQDQRSVLWCLVVDDFVGDAFEDLGAEWLDAIGLDTDGDLATVGERVWTLTRLFNVREGVSRADDELPAKLQEPLDSGPNAGAAIDTESFDAMLDEYYSQRGWDATAGPPPRQSSDSASRTPSTNRHDQRTRHSENDRRNRPRRTRRTGRRGDAEPGRLVLEWKGRPRRRTRPRIDWDRIGAARQRYRG